MLTWILCGIASYLAYRLYRQNIDSACDSPSVDNAATGQLNRRVLTSMASSPTKSLPPAAWPLIAIAYAVCPLDGDFIPLVGWIDDVLVACLAAYKWWSARRPLEKA